MRLFLFGSYAEKRSTTESDIDVFITNDSLSGYARAQFKHDFPEIKRVTRLFEFHSTKNGGKLDLYTDCRSEFHSLYSNRRLFGEEFELNLDQLQESSKEIKIHELHEILSFKSHEDIVLYIERTLNRNQFLQ
jgi:hypothetical protein